MRVFCGQDPDLYAKLPEPEDDENDMLDLAYGLTETYAFLTAMLVFAARAGRPAILGALRRRTRRCI